MGRLRYLSFLSACYLFQNFSAYAQEGAASRSFLRDLLKEIKIHEKMGADHLLTTMGGEGGKAPEELALIRQASMHSFADITAPTQRKTKEVLTYNFLLPKNHKERVSDRENLIERKCELAEYDVEAGTFEVRPWYRLGFHKLPKSKKGWSFSYCYGIDKSSEANSVLYFFHGVSGDVKNFWNRHASSNVRYLWRKTDPNTPIWVSVSMGRIGLLSGMGKEKRFVEKIMPFIESRLSAQTQKPITKRIALGVSMGGANVTNLIFNPDSHLSRAFLVCPAIGTFENYTKEEIAAYIKRTSAMKFAFGIAMMLLPYEFLNQSYFDAYDPLMRGQRALSPSTPPIYIQTSSKDQFGFQEGGRLFAMVARIKGAPVSFEELKGPHCVFKPKTVVDFLRM